MNSPASRGVSKDRRLCAISNRRRVAPQSGLGAAVISEPRVPNPESRIPNFERAPGWAPVLCGLLHE
ncbi:MAG: hypothetical protein ACRD3O_22600, partial [Terriglobia bacterium]